MKKLLALMGLLSVGAAIAQQPEAVNGYFRQDGTYVAPHMATKPDGNVMNNYSTRGNVNPYTGAPGTVNPYAVRPAPPVAPMARPAVPAPVYGQRQVQAPVVNPY